MVDTYEYPDFPMSESKYGVAKFNHIPGAVLHRYLTDYAKHFGVFERVQFHTQVDLVHQLDDGSWRITVSTPKGVRDVVSKRLIVATGLTSTPNMPHYKNEAEFARVRAFCEGVRLPLRLRDIGIDDATEEKLQTIAARACRAGEIIHNEPIPVTPAMVVEALQALI